MLIIVLPVIIVCILLLTLGIERYYNRKINAEKISTLEFADALGKIAQITAVVMAGVWAYYIFVQKDKPEIDKPMTLRIFKDTCTFPTNWTFAFKWGVEIRNDSKRTYKVTKTVLQYCDVPNDTLRKTGYFDEVAYIRNHTNDSTYHKIVSPDSVHSYLTYKYGPGGSSGQVYTVNTWWKQNTSVVAHLQVYITSDGDMILHKISDSLEASRIFDMTVHFPG
jgi:hypothetical protein